MKNTFGYIKSRPDDFKVCKDCLAINWYGNKDCLECGSESFDESREKVMELIESKMDAWQESFELKDREDCLDFELQV